MAALSMPDLPHGPLRDLVAELHLLHANAAWPSLRAVAESAGIGKDAVQKLFSTLTLPNSDHLLKVTEVLATTACARRARHGETVEGWCDTIDAMYQTAARSQFLGPSTGAELAHLPAGATMGASLPDRPTSHAVMVGISAYTNPKLDALPGTSEQVARLRELLTDPANPTFVGENVSFLTAPNREELLAAVRHAADNAEDALLVYFAGHGLISRHGELLLAGPATDPDADYTAITYADIRELVSASKAQRAVVVLDACYSGQATNTLGPLDGLSRIPTSLVLTAAGPYQAALRHPHGPAFTRALIDILAHGIPNGPTLLDITAIYTELRRRARTENFPRPHLAGQPGTHPLALAANHAAGSSSGAAAAVIDEAIHPRPSIDLAANAVLSLQNVGQRARIERVELPGGVQAWSINDATLLEELLLDPRVSANPRPYWSAFGSGELGPNESLHWSSLTPNIATAYGADHSRLRRLIAPAFTEERIRLMRGQIEHIADSMLSPSSRSEANRAVDLRGVFADPFSTLVLFTVIGVPDSQLFDLIGSVSDLVVPGATEQVIETSYTKSYPILAEVVDHRRYQPGHDLTSLLLSQRDDDGSSLTETELIETLLLVITAGHLTMVNLLDQAITAILTHPEVLGELRTGTLLAWAELIEETLQLQSPVAHSLRFAVEDLDIDGVRIAKGEPILADYAAANRDTQRHGGPTANHFDHDRENLPHLAFAYGVHHCLAAPLARLAALVFLPALFERFPAMTLAMPADELDILPRFGANGHHELRVFLHDRNFGAWAAEVSRRPLRRQRRRPSRARKPQGGDQ